MTNRIIKREHPTDEIINAYPYFFGMVGDRVTWTAEKDKAFNPGPWMNQTLLQLKSLPGDKSVKYAVEQKEMVS